MSKWYTLSLEELYETGRDVEGLGVKVGLIERNVDWSAIGSLKYIWDPIVEISSSEDMVVFALLGIDLIEMPDREYAEIVDLAVWDSYDIGMRRMILHGAVKFPLEKV